MFAPFLRLIVGSGDQGAVDFAALGKPKTPNTALIAPEGYVTGRRSDDVSPVYDRPAAELRAALKAIVLAEDAVELVASDDAALYDRYVQHSALMGYPDTIDVKAIDLGDGRSTLALYSRSLLGIRDFGVNLARLRRWLGKLEKAA